MSVTIHVPPALHASRATAHPATYRVVAGIFASTLMAFAMGAAFGLRGQFLGALGANGLEVSATAGIATWLGVVAWLLARRALVHGNHYPVMAITGCVLTLVPLSLIREATSWPAVSTWLVLAGAGLGLWASSLDGLLGAAQRPSGSPWILRLQRAWAQTAFAWGALMMTAVLLSGGTLRMGFADLWMLLPLAGVATIAAAAGRNPLRAEARAPASGGGQHARLRLRLFAVAMMTMGLADYALLAYLHATSDPRLYAWLPGMGAMGAMMAVISARLLRRALPLAGRRTDGIVGLLTLLYAPCAINGGPALFALGMLLWGGGLGALHAWAATTLADGLPHLPVMSRRGVAHLLLGSAGLLGSVLLGAASLAGHGWLTAVAMVFQATGLACLVFSRPPSTTREIHA